MVGTGLSICEVMVSLSLLRAIGETFGKPKFSVRPEKQNPWLLGAYPWGAGEVIGDGLWGQLKY